MGADEGWPCAGKEGSVDLVGGAACRHKNPSSAQMVCDGRGKKGTRGFTFNLRMNNGWETDGKRKKSRWKSGSKEKRI